MKIIVVSQLARNKFARKVPARRAREKHMLEAEESSVRLYFVLFDKIPTMNIKPPKTSLK